MLVASQEKLIRKWTKLSSVGFLGENRRCAQILFWNCNSNVLCKLQFCKKFYYYRFTKIIFKLRKYPNNKISKHIRRNRIICIMGIHLENNDSLESQYYHTPWTLIYKINWNYIAYLFKPYWPFLCQLFFSRQNRSIILKSEQGHKTYSHFKRTRKLLRLYWHNNKNAALHELQTVFLSFKSFKALYLF